MGTRHLTIVAQGGTYKVAQYGQWDGYPSGQGINILSFLKKASMVDFLNKISNNVKFISESELKKKYEAVGVFGNTLNWDQAERFNKAFPELSRDTGSDVLDIIYKSNNVVELKDSITFAGDSLFCEWAYVIDLDNNTFEVYQGFNKDKLSSDDRFYWLQSDNEEYFPVKLVANFKLDILPSDEEFLCIEKCEDE